MLFTRLGSPQSTSSTQLSADTAYSALWHLLITHWQIPNRIFTDCQYAALQAEEVIWINHARTHASNKVQNSKSQGRTAYPSFREFQKGLLMTVGYGPYAARGETHWISTAYTVLQLQIFFPRTNCSVPSRTRGWSLADPHHKFHLTEKPWIFLTSPNKISSPILTGPHHIYQHTTFPSTS